jgi:PAS domain S-box-containing protein
MEIDFSRVIDTLPGLIWTAVADGRVDFVNKRWSEYTGLSFEDACGEGLQAALHPGDRSQLIERWQAFTTSGEAGEMEARLRRFDGEYRWFLLRFCPLTDASGEVVKWCGINTDIEDRKRAEEAVRIRDGHNRSVADSIPTLIAYVTPAGEVESVNQSVLDYLGASLEEVKRRVTSDTVHPDDLPTVGAAWTRAVETAEPYDVEHRIRRADGAYRWFHVRALPLEDAEGRVARWYCLQTDIDDQKRAEALLAGEKRLLQMVAEGALLTDVLEALCRIVEDTAIGSLCSVLTIDPDGVRFRHGAGPSLPAAYNEVLDGLIMDRHYGPCGMAANLKAQVIASDVLSDSRWRSSPWPALVAGHGLRSCWSTPILSRDNKVIGVFALYQRQPGDPTALELDLISQFAHLAGIAIERMQSDAALKSSEVRKAAILDSALDCIITIDHQGRITEFNPAAEQTFGFRMDEVVGQSLADTIIPSSLRDEHRRGLARYLATGVSQVIGRHIELTAVRADGSEFPVELAITRIPSDGPPSFTGFLRDISGRKQAEEELRRSEAFLAEGQRLSVAGSFSWRLDNDEITFSAELCRIFGFDPDSTVTLERIGGRVHPEDMPLLSEKSDLARNGGEGLSYEVRLQMPDGSVKHLHTVARVMLGHEGRPEIIGAVQDITDRRASEETLSRLRSELTRMARVMSLGALTASIAHEVNQPLSGIITNASTCLRMLAADPPNVEGAQETARRTVRDGNRAADVIKRLRALFTNKDTTGEAVDLNEAAREVIALSASDLQRGRASLRAELADNLPHVTGDRIQLQQVILNLLSNAIDAMSGVEDHPRQLLIRTEREEADRVSLSIKDAGVGFEPGRAETLFQAFYTTKSEGMGIGLFVSRSIIENHGGRLWAEANDGPGATFSFSVPCSVEGAAGAGDVRPLGRSAEAVPQPVMVRR